MDLGFVQSLVDQLSNLWLEVFVLASVGGF